MLISTMLIDDQTVMLHKKKLAQIILKLLSMALSDVDSDVQEPLNAPFLNGLFCRGFSRGKTAH